MSAGIRVWVLTGDKQETAIEIGKSCNLINMTTMDLVILSSKSLEEFDQKLHAAINQKSFKNKKCIVVDGLTLTFILEKDEVAKKFF